MKKLQAVHPADVRKVMEVLTEELAPLLKYEGDPKQIHATQVFLGTLYQLTLKLFEWLPTEEQHNIFITCGAWFDIGLMMGKAPATLVKILDRANPSIGEVEVPDWAVCLSPLE